VQPAAFSLAPDHAARFTLPVSGIGVTLRHPTGAEDLLLIECTGNDDAAALALAQRLAEAANGGEIAWANLPTTDLDVLVLRLRQAIFGDRIVSDLTCAGAACGSRVDISFGIEAYLAHHHPRAAVPRGRFWHVTACTDEPGWFNLVLQQNDAGETGARFRLPTVADQIYAAGERDPEFAMVRVCIRPDGVPAPLRRRVETVMEAMAPALSGELQGACPDCGTMVAARFDPRRYCLQEMRDRARFVYQDVDLLARRYHWAEQTILALPNGRRANYVELALAGGSA
jgi:hypothetical protein